MHARVRNPGREARLAKKALNRPLRVRLIATLAFIFVVVGVREWVNNVVVNKTPRPTVPISLAIDWVSEWCDADTTHKKDVVRPSLTLLRTRRSGCTGIEVESVAITTQLRSSFPNLHLNQCDGRCTDLPVETAKVRH